MTLSRLAVVLVGAWLATAVAGAAERPAVQLDIAAQPLGQALDEFATQSGLQVVFYTRVMEHSYKAPALSGRFSPEEALRRLLAGTPLQYKFVNARTVAIHAPGKSESGEGQALSRTQSLAPASTNGRYRNRVGVLSPVHTLQRAGGAEEEPATVVNQATIDADAPRTEGAQEVVVTGSRIRSLLGAATIQPVVTLTAEDIERTGATSLGELFGYVPQVSSYTEGIFEHPVNVVGALPGLGSTDTRTTATLRGAPNGGTLLLINGRRAPRNGQASASTDAYDLSGIPLAAIERIEFLLDGASAVYGADAVGGVINVILKRSYKGVDAKLSYGNTFDTDVHVLDTSLTFGFGRGKLSGVMTLSHAESGSLMWRDRDFLSSFNRQEWGSSNFTGSSAPSGNGSIRLPAGNPAGLPANTLVTIPAGSNGSNMTVADYAAALTIPPATDQALWATYNSPYVRQSALATLEYALRPNVDLFAEFRTSESTTMISGGPLLANNLTIPADAPGNVFGVPVVMRRYFWDLPFHHNTSVRRNHAAVFGLRARFGSSWRLEATVGPTFTRPSSSDPYGSTISAVSLNEALAGPPERRPNLFYDATMEGLNPNDAALLKSLGSPSSSLERGETWLYQLSVDGSLLKLWAGDLRVAAGTEYRADLVQFPLQSPTNTTEARARNRYATGVFTEVSLPLVSAAQGLPLINSLDISVAARRDFYSGGEFADAVKPRYGLMYRPASWLMLRASYGEGYKIPSLAQLYAPQRLTNTSFSAINPVRDIYRDGEPLPSPLTTIVGGNPDLKPEETESSTAGLVLELPFAMLNGLSFSFDFFEHRYLNRISSLVITDRMALFPEHFHRGPNLPTDPPGWPGPVIEYDNRVVNVASNLMAGWDAGVRYYRGTPWGQVRLNYRASRVERVVNRALPGAEPNPNAIPKSLPMRMSGDLSWSKSGLEVAFLMAYREKMKLSLADRGAPSAIRWDVRARYDFSRSAMAGNLGSPWTAWLGRTRMSLTIFNMFDKDPPLYGSVALPETSVVDALGRRYTFTVTTSFGTGKPGKQ